MSTPENELDALGAQLDASHGEVVVPTHAASHALIEETARLSEHPVLAGSSDEVELARPSRIGEVIDDTGEAFVRRKQVSFRSGEKVGIRDELEPLKPLMLELHPGERVDCDVLASINLGENGQSCKIVRELDGVMSLVTIDHKGGVLAMAQLSNDNSWPHADIRVGSGMLEVYNFDTPAFNQVWTIEYAPDDGNETPAVLELEVAKAVRVESKSIQEEKEKGRRMNWLKRTVGAVAIVATLAPGGLIDSLADQFVTSQQTVQTAVETFEPHYSTVDANGDPWPQSVIDEMHGADKAWEQAQAAGGVVEQTFNNLDDHNYQEILQQAEQYRQQHSNEFMSDEKATELFDALEAAQTKDEVLSALRSLGEFYGYEFTASDATSVDAVKHTAEVVAKFLINLPKHYTDQAELETISFETTEELIDAYGTISEGVAVYGTYDPNENKIRIGTDDAFWEFVKNHTTFIPGAQPGYSVQEKFAHEFGHALAVNQTYPAERSDQSAGDAYTTETMVRDVVLGGILQNPEVISNYSRSSWEESGAEYTSGILSDRSDGLASPDEVRRFNSPANQVMIKRLIAIEMSDPGFANYLIALNNRLMQGEALGYH